MLCILGDPLLAPALDAGEVGLGEIDGHPGRLPVDIGEVAVQGRLGDRGVGGDLAEAAVALGSGADPLDTLMFVAEDEGGAARAKRLPYVPLPRGLIDPREQARTVFDAIVVLYDAARPDYPPEVFAELQARCNLSPASHVLEIGCGSGQATRSLATSGAAIHGLEPGPVLADLARENLARNPNVRITTSTFEAADDEPGAYDLIVSATAFHWIDPNISFAKAARLLRPGGSLALLTNAHGSAGTHTDERVAETIRHLHRQLAPEVGSWTFPSLDDIRGRAKAGGDIAAVWSRVERKFTEPPSVSDLFEPPLVSTYPWVATYDRADYLAMLASQSSYALMDQTRRELLLDAIGRLIDERLGRTVTKEYITVLATARRRAARSATSTL
jgi:SAM-dependent methyltransferase